MIISSIVIKLFFLLYNLSFSSLQFNRFISFNCFVIKLCIIFLLFRIDSNIFLLSDKSLIINVKENNFSESIFISILSNISFIISNLINENSFSSIILLFFSSLNLSSYLIILHKVSAIDFL